MLDLLPQFAALIKFRKIALTQLKMEIQHDLWHVLELVGNSTETLEQVQRHLDLKIERSKNRIQQFMGSPDKIAMFSLAGMGFSVLKEFPLNSTVWSNNWFQYGLAFLTGISIGGILLNAVIQRYVYHRGLIQLALEFQAKNEKPTRLYSKPELPLNVKWRRKIEKVYVELRGIMTRVFLC